MGGWMADECCPFPPPLPSLTFRQVCNQTTCLGVLQSVGELILLNQQMTKFFLSKLFALLQPRVRGASSWCNPLQERGSQPEHILRSSSNYSHLCHHSHFESPMHGTPSALPLLLFMSLQFLARLVCMCACMFACTNAFHSWLDYHLSLFCTCLHNPKKLFCNLQFLRTAPKKHILGNNLITYTAVFILFVSIPASCAFSSVFGNGKLGGCAGVCWAACARPWKCHTDVHGCVRLHRDVQGGSCEYACRASQDVLFVWHKAVRVLKLQEDLMRTWAPMPASEEWWNRQHHDNNNCVWMEE